MLTAHLNKKLSALIPDAPFAIAFSGGGDSTALVHALKDHPQAKCVFIVDHALRKRSDIEAEAAARFARECGYEAEILTWRHDSPETAIQEKARCARYGLMGAACRKIGIKYLLTAHSEDDQAETLLMRYDRKTDWRGAAGMAELNYGPVWPQLAMVTLVRPLLGVTRQALRDYNRAQNLTWIEDPSNQSRDYARIRARDYLSSRPDLRDDLLNTGKFMRGHMQEEGALLRQQFAQIGQIDPHGIITLAGLPYPELLFHCLRAGGGQGGVIDRAKIKKLLVKMRAPDFKSATLGGALVARHKDGFVICRDPVAVKGREDSHHSRKGLRERLGMRLNLDPQIWDGRFSVTGPEHHSYMGSVHQETALLKPEQREALKAIAAPARPSLPVLKDENGIRIVGHQDMGSRTVMSLVQMRLEAALGGKLS